jgi:hypothetical protein
MKKPGTKLWMAQAVNNRENTWERRYYNGVGRIESGELSPESLVGSLESGELGREAAKGTKTGSNAKGKFASSLKENTERRKAGSAS